MKTDQLGGEISKVLRRTVARRPLILLFVLAIIAWAPGLFTFPPLDRDESRFAQATKQMLESGNYVDIRFGNEPRYKKPVGIYWLQAASTAILSPDHHYDRIWTYRIPSFLGGLAALALCFWIVRAFASVETAFFAALLLGSTLLLASEVKIAKTDAVLLAAVLASQGVLMRAYLSARIREHPPPSVGITLLGWAAFALGLLVKGPVILLVCLAGIVAVSLWDRDWRWLARVRPVSGIALTLLLVLPWFIAIEVRSHGAFFQESLLADFAQKIVGAEETHGAPPGYYLVLAGLSFWPATLVLIPAVVFAFHRRADAPVRYLIAWGGVNWLLFEFAPTKLPHYILPAYPTLAILAAMWLCSSPGSPEGRHIRWASAGLFAIGGFVVAGLLVWAPMRFGAGTPWFLYVVGALGAGVITAAAAMAVSARMGVAVALAIVSALILYPLAAYGTAPRLQQLWLSPRLAKLVSDFRRPGDPPPVVSGYAEPSLVFLLGKNTILRPGVPAGVLAAHQGGLALVEARQRQRFLESVQTHGGSAKVLGEVTGVNYSRGRQEAITLYRVKKGLRP